MTRTVIMTEVTVTTPLMYRYDIVQKELDAFAKIASNEQYRRAYHRFKAILVATAYVDYMTVGVGLPQALSWAWEDAHMGFIGRGEPMMNAAVITLWMWVIPSERPLFSSSLKGALDRADRETDVSIPRRYLPKWRLKPLRMPEDGFNESQILPCWGPALREFCSDNGDNFPDIEGQLIAQEQADRLQLAEDRVRAASLDVAKAKKKKK